MKETLKYFVGRENELETFKRCFSSQSQNGVYYYGPGGIGKSMLLKKILEVCEKELGCGASFIDFFSTDNRSIQGVQTTIMEGLEAPQAFEEIDELREKITQIQQAPDFIGKKEQIISLQKQLDASFVYCCQEAAQDRVLVLLFDSFEYVQRRDTGRWFLKDFLPHLQGDTTHGIIVVLSGRPDPEAAQVPPNLFKSPLGKLQREDVRVYFEERMEIPWSDDLEVLYQVSDGNPLIIELLRWRGDMQLIQSLRSLKEPIHDPKVMAEKIFDKLMHDEYKVIRRVLWAMATLKRRFDVDMLKYLVDNMKWLRRADYDTIREQLREFPFVKNDEEAASHLLHDVVIEPISILFKGVDELGQLRDNLFQEIVDQYYPARIETASYPHLEMYLKAEQLGYIAERDLQAGIKRYKAYLKEIGQTNNFHFDDLLWEELYAHLKKHPQENIDFILEKAKWFYENGWYSGLEILGRNIYEMPGIEDQYARLQGCQYFAFALMRQGRLREAETQFQESLNIATHLQSTYHIAETENNFAQVALLSGRYDAASKHYWKALGMYSSAEHPQKLAITYSSYGFTLAMQGHYQRALTQCKQALTLFDKHPDPYRQLYTFGHISVVYQLMGDYDRAKKYLEQGLQCAEQGGFIELEAETLRKLAHTAYLRGRRVREEENDFNADCEAQGEALEKLVMALDRARSIVHPIQISRSVVQLAQVLEEIARIESAVVETGQEPPLYLEGLLEEVRELRIAEDVTYHFEHRLEHFPDSTFAELTLLHKAARLVEIGIIGVSPELNQSYFMLENQVELARFLLQLQAWQDVEHRVQIIKDTRPGIYDDRVLLALCSLIQADLACDRGDFSNALTRYAQAIPELSDVQEIPVQLFKIRIGELVKRIRSIEDQDTALEWCQALQATWIETSVADRFPEVIEGLQILAHEMTGQ